MSKYEALRDYLSARSDALPQLTLTFADVEAMVGPLPDSARLNSGWWANDSRHEAAVWGEVGWRVRAVDQAAERVVFARGAVGGRSHPRDAATTYRPGHQPDMPAPREPRTESDPYRITTLTGFGAAGRPPGDQLPGDNPAASDVARHGQPPGDPISSDPARSGVDGFNPDGFDPDRFEAAPDDLPDSGVRVRAAWPDTAAPARGGAATWYSAESAPAIDAWPASAGGASAGPAEPGFGAEGDRHSRRARRLAAHLDASLRAVTGRGFTETSVPADFLPPPRDPADNEPNHGPRTPHGATQPGRYGGVLDPGIPPGVVEAMLEHHLAGEGWSVRHPPDRRTDAVGASLTATRHNRTLAITVQGYPAFVPSRGDSDEAPAPPPLRARQWYAQALLEALLIRGAQPDVDIAVGLPDVPAYRALYARSRDTFGRLNLLVFFAGADGQVRDH